MNKLLLGVCLFFVGSFLEAKPLFEEYKTKILEASDTSAIIADSSAFVVGSSGVVMHKFVQRALSWENVIQVINCFKNVVTQIVRFRSHFSYPIEYFE